MAGSALQTWEVKEPYLDLHCELGEGPYYEAATHSLRFVDIRKKQVHTISLSEGPASLKTLQLDVPVSVTANIEGLDPREKILVGLKYGIAVLDRATGQYEYLTRFEDLQDSPGNVRLRSNDGAADPHGRFWLGSMTDFGHGVFQPEGRLYRFDGAKGREVFRDGLTIPNTIAWSPDRNTMYFTNSTSRQVTAWDYDTDQGTLSNERVFYEHAGPGFPDGCAVDKDGNLWHAVWGESRVLKLSPQGAIVGEVKLPTPNVTCPEFVGTELFITTAEDDEGDSNSKKYEGGLFRVDVGTTGIGHFDVKLGE